MQVPVKPRLDMQRLYQDAEKYAALTNVPFKGEVVQKFLNAYRELYAESAVAFRTTTRPKAKRELSMR